MKKNLFVILYAMMMMMSAGNAYAAETAGMNETDDAAMDGWADDGTEDAGAQEMLQSAIGEYVADDSGHLIAIESGEIYYPIDGDGLYADGIADDGYVYTDGKQENTLSYYAEKYYAAYQGAPESGFLTYDSMEEFGFFLGYLQCTEGARQGFDYEYWSVNGTSKIRVQKSEIQRVIGSLSADYESRIQELAAGIPQGLSVKDTVYWADIRAAELFEYDYDYLTTDMETALSDGRGVCFHYAKAEHDILAVLGISSEYVIGSYAGAGHDISHVWLRVWDPENGQWLYKDPTKEHSYVVDQRMYWDISYASYATRYIQAPAVAS